MKHFQTYLFLFFFLLFIACESQDQTNQSTETEQATNTAEKQVAESTKSYPKAAGAPSPIGPYSQAVLANGTLYVSASSFLPHMEVSC